VHGELANPWNITNILQPKMFLQMFCKLSLHILEVYKCLGTLKITEAFKSFGGKSTTA
jgi:hypothetical protein